ncbi:hypothetical protein JHK87_042641 [Glycine soja]|nr:hypothetical protein JHK87_042641 [Glycine soja]
MEGTLIKGPPLRPPVQLGEITAEELKAYDGTDPEKPLLMAIKAQIYDVSQSSSMNCAEQCVPVRVIRGHESSSNYTGKVYTYDGLYKVIL